MWGEVWVQEGGPLLEEVSTCSLPLDPPVAMDTLAERVWGINSRQPPSVLGFRSSCSQTDRQMDRPHLSHCSSICPSERQEVCRLKEGVGSGASVWGIFEFLCLVFLTFTAGLWSQHYVESILEEGGRVLDFSMRTVLVSVCRLRTVYQSAVSREKRLYREQQQTFWLWYQK